MKFIKTKFFLIIVLFFFFPFREDGVGASSFAQNVGINTTGNAPNSSALLDVDASPGNNKGLLIPRLPLTASNVGAPISPAPGAAEKGLMVYNTATAGISPNDVVPGFYYWNGSAWAPLGGGGSTGGWTDDGTVVRLTTSTDFVGIGTASPASTSALDITSTTKGILIPRMTIAQRDAISTPATGLQVYNTDCSTLDYWTGTCWISTRKSLPDPDPITSVPATTTFCAGQNRTYSVTAIPGATKYGWTVPAGTTINSGQLTNSITVTFGNISGSVCVKASNACETSGQTCLAVNVDPIPNTPGNITGITSINPGQQSVTYFVASVNGASTYTWSVPAGATIASGTGTTTIVVNFACNASSGNISVTANSTCGSSPASALALTITPLLAASAGSAVFGGVAIGGSPTATGGTTAYAYSWSPATNLSSSTVANPTALCTGATTTYTVTITDSRSCTETNSVIVTRNLTVSAGAAKFGGAAIGGSPTATGGNPTYTYSWSPAADLSSSTVANPTALCTGSTTTYTVTATDANGCTGTSSVLVTRNLAVNAGAAKFGGTTIGGTATGGNPTYTYAWSPATNLSSSVVAIPTALCTGATTTYTVTATDATTCTSTSSVVVTRNLTASAGVNQSVTCSGVAIGGSPTANGGNATYTYSWNPGTGLSSATAANPTAGASGSTTTYTVTATDANGCTATSSMILTRSGCSITFSYTGSLQTWTVPSGVTSITIDAYGAQGQAGTNNASGGLGGRAQGALAVTPGEILNFYIGGQVGWNGGGTGGTGAATGGFGSNAGNGGGASDIRQGGTALANRVIVSAGGGGGGNRYYNGGWCCSIGTGNGGIGGAVTGGNGTNGGGGSGASGNGGLGGTASAGGTGGSGATGCGNGGVGSIGIGGNGPGGSYNVAAGGGGGGYYGGGGGETACAGSGGAGGGGGGGSSYLGGVSGSSTTGGVRAGNGQIVITY